MQFCSSCKNVPFSTELLCPTNSNNFQLNRINVVPLQIGEVYNNLLEAIIRPVLQNDALVFRLVSNVADIDSPKFEKLCVIAFGAL